jgi:hypothetical protein
MSARWLLTAVLAGALALPAVAHAGGWATVSLSSTPDGLPPDKPWVVDLEILQHGVTPLEGVEPTVILTKGATTRTFTAEPTGKPGVYLAQVTFPSGGEWNYKVNDGFSQTHGFAPVQIGPDGAEGGFAMPDWAWALLAAAGALAVLFLVGRRLRPATAPVAQ